MKTVFEWKNMFQELGAQKRAIQNVRVTFFVTSSWWLCSVGVFVIVVAAAAAVCIQANPNNNIVSRSKIESRKSHRKAMENHSSSLK